MQRVLLNANGKSDDFNDESAKYSKMADTLPKSRPKKEGTKVLSSDVH